MNSTKRLFYILSGLMLVMAVVFIGGAYQASTILQASAHKVLDARAKGTALEQQTTQLSRAKSDVQKYQELGNIARSIVPQDKNQAQTVLEIVNIAKANGIKLGTITFPDSSLGSNVKSGTTSGSASGSSTAPSKSSASALPSQLIAVPSLSGVFSLQITVQSDSNSPVPYAKLLSFLAALEGNRRTALVSGITVSPSTKDPSLVSFTLNMDEYIKP